MFTNTNHIQKSKFQHGSFSFKACWEVDIWIELRAVMKWLCCFLAGAGSCSGTSQLGQRAHGAVCTTQPEKSHSGPAQHTQTSVKHQIEVYFCMRRNYLHWFLSAKPSIKVALKVLAENKMLQLWKFLLLHIKQDYPFLIYNLLFCGKDKYF